MEKHRKAPLEISSKEFKSLGYKLIESISEFNETIANKPVTTGEKPKQLQGLLGNKSFPESGMSNQTLLGQATDLLFNHSLFNGHPKFMGYITGSAAPIGALGDMLAATVNPNVGAFALGPMATEIEKQTIQWLAEFVGVSSDYGGVLVSGGNMANFTAFLAARTAKAPSDIKENGINSNSKKLIMYCSKSTHTWIDKAAILFGHGTNAIRWIETDADNKMNLEALELAITSDIKDGHDPFFVVGTAGDVSTGTVDDLEGIASICKLYDLWFHVDGAYGVPANILPELEMTFKGIKDADSIAIDPHKWLYSPLEAGCTLVKNPKHLVDAYSSHPEYYNFATENAEQNFYEYGLQNSRGFRALKIWLMLQQVGRNGYREMISEDIELSKLLFNLSHSHSELEAVTQNLSITTFRYIPTELAKDIKDQEAYLNKLNETLVNNLQQGGKVFVSNAIVHNAYCLRSCIVNFRTSKKDIEEIVDIVVAEGRKLHKELLSK
ncbi:aminotransferase class V-fold PLP-dependent enzyme [Psychroserpens sp. AS72]|uniref:pyridoxal phosphate-dependent decarboxylase family protein n=1 Tax=Psychroserpens sp. AS72 TaxID=3135775 RepID=UPI0031805421